MHAVLIDSSPGLRRFPFAHESPTSLLPVLERPLLSHTVRWLRKLGATEIAYATERNPAADLDLAMAIVENRLRPVRTLGEALERARRDLRMDETLLVMHANLHYLPHFSTLLSRHMIGRQAMTYVRGSSMQGPGRYTFGPPVMALCSPVVSRMMRFADSRRPLQHMLRRVRERGLATAAHEPEERVLSIDNTYSLYHANLDVLSNGFVSKAIAAELGLEQRGERLWSAPGANLGHVRVDPTGGPVLVGAGARIGDDAILRGPTIVGSGSEVGAGSCLHRSLVLSDSNIPEQSWVANSVVSSRLRERIAA
ncbi:MAG: NDP-sugar synthase [Deltaproteobacteria bacterium]|nr:NDP-sugar synthase [Deltaproteobacteria bacterium]